MASPRRNRHAPPLQGPCLQLPNVTCSCLSLQLPRIAAGLWRRARQHAVCQPPTTARLHEPLTQSASATGLMRSTQAFCSIADGTGGLAAETQDLAMRLLNLQVCGGFGSASGGGGGSVAWRALSLCLEARRAVRAI